MARTQCNLVAHQVSSYKRSVRAAMRHMQEHVDGRKKEDAMKRKLHNRLSSTADFYSGALSSYLTTATGYYGSYRGFPHSFQANMGTVS